MTRERELEVHNFGPIAHALVPLRDLIILVGPQATGKSLLLQLLKLAEDHNRVASLLAEHGFDWRRPADFASLYFGAGLENAWSTNARVRLGRRKLTLQKIAASRARDDDDDVFYIPAHRTITIADGWPRPFQQYDLEIPFVARLFSESLRRMLSRRGRSHGQLFPIDRRLKVPLRRAIDDAVFHGGELRLEVTGMRKRLKLQYEDVSIPFMGWTSGQREFVPLLLGLYHLLTAGGATKRPETTWVIIEEPEMGLHPKAIIAVMGTVLELLHRGYKVALSTHSQTVLDVIWGLNHLRQFDDGPRSMCKIFGLEPSSQMLALMESALGSTNSITYMTHGDKGVESKDITNLDPSAESEAEANWGGLTEFGGRVADVVADSVARSGRS
ncbi:MAG: AAA family ATPase [Myxococcota bacterium]